MHYDPLLSSPQHRILKWNSSGCACLCLEEGQLGSTGPGDGVCHTSGLREGLELQEKCASSSSSLQGHNLISAIPHNISPNTALIIWYKNTRWSLCSALNVFKKNVMVLFTLVFSIPEVPQVGGEK